MFPAYCLIRHLFYCVGKLVKAPRETRKPPTLLTASLHQFLRTKNAASCRTGNADRAPPVSSERRSDTIPEPVQEPGAASHSESTHTARVQPFPTPPLFHSLFSARNPVHRRASAPRSHPCLCVCTCPVYAQRLEAHSVPFSCGFDVLGTLFYAMPYKSRQTWTVPLFIQPS